MPLFGLINYEDYLLKSVVKSNYAKNGLTVLLMLSITGMLRFHLSIIICYLLTINPYIDFLVSILVGLVMSYTSNNLYQYTATQRSKYEEWITYLINNYNRDNIIIWKRYCLLGICSYIFFILKIMELNNQVIFISTCSTIITFVISDLIDNHQKIRASIFDLKLRWSMKYKSPKNKFPETNHLFESNESNVINERPPSPPRLDDDVVEKPPTPPTIRRKID